MFHGDPLPLFEHGGEAGGEIRDHKEGKGEDAEDLFSRRGMDFLPFRHGRHQSVEKKKEIAGEKKQSRLQKRREEVSRHGTEDQADGVCHGRE